MLAVTDIIHTTPASLPLSSPPSNQLLCCSEVRNWPQFRKDIRRLPIGGLSRGLRISERNQTSLLRRHLKPTRPGKSASFAPVLPRKIAHATPALNGGCMGSVYELVTQSIHEGRTSLFAGRSELSAAADDKWRYTKNSRRPSYN